MSLQFASRIRAARVATFLSLFVCTHAAADAAVPEPVGKTKAKPTARRDSSKKVKPMQVPNPYLTLRIETDSMPYGVYVNGAPLTADETGGPANETWPINHMLRSGANEIALLTPPYETDDGKSAFDKKARATLTVMVQEAGHLDRPGIPLMELCFVGERAGTESATNGSSPEGQFDSSRQFIADKSGDVIVNKPRVRTINDDGVLLISRAFAVGLSLPEWEFLGVKTDVVPTLYEGTATQAEKLYAGLFAAYEEIWNGLRTGNIDAIMPLFEERSRNTDRAMYLTPGTTQQRLKESFVEVLRDRTMTLQPIKVEGFWSLDVGPGGRLMRLVTGAHSSAILRFEDKDGLSVVYPVTFRRKGGRYIVAL